MLGRYDFNRTLFESLRSVQTYDDFRNAILTHAMIPATPTRITEIFEKELDNIVNISKIIIYHLDVTCNLQETVLVREMVGAALKFLQSDLGKLVGPKNKDSREFYLRDLRECENLLINQEAYQRLMESEEVLPKGLPSKVSYYDYNPIDETKVKQFFKKYIKNLVLRVEDSELKHGTHSIYLDHFRNHGISATYPAPLRELIFKIDLIWEQHADHTLRQTEYFRTTVQRIKEANEQQKIAISFSTNDDVIREFTTGARHGGEWMRECRVFLREAYSSWEKFNTEEQETLKILQALRELMCSLPAMIVSMSIYHEAHYKSFKAFLAFIKKECLVYADLDQYLCSLQKSLDHTIPTKYERVIAYPIETERLKFTILPQKVLEDFNGPYLEVGKRTALNSNQIVQHRLLVNGFSEHPEYRDSRFVVEQTGDYNNVLVTRRLLSEEDQKEFIEQTQKRKRIQYWIEAFHCQELIEKYRVYF